jgi:membrane dipeptidase
MMSRIKKIVILTSIGLAMSLLAILVFAPAYVEQQFNRVARPVVAPVISLEAQAVHEALFVVDWHSDSLMWDRDLNEYAHFGHVDFPRLQQGNVALQMFTTVTKSPSGINYDRNEATAADSVTQLALVQAWPIATLTSLMARALHQGHKLHAFIAANPEQIHFVSSKKSLQEFLVARQANQHLVGALLGTEGSHALDGELDNIQVLFDAGFRMMSLQHFFDNKLGGSLHGVSQQGLTEFGREAVQRMQEKQIIVDVSHSSEQVVRDVLAMSQQPLVVSHTGFYGHCQTPRNIADELMQAIAAQGGLIAVGYWDGAVCEINPASIAAAIKYDIELVGVDHIALGSDFDGATTTALDTSELVQLTQALIAEGLSLQQISAVMGGNSLRFLQNNLPD